MTTWIYTGINYAQNAAATAVSVPVQAVQTLVSLPGRAVNTVLNVPSQLAAGVHIVSIGLLFPACKNTGTPSSDYLKNKPKLLMTLPPLPSIRRSITAPVP